MIYVADGAAWNGPRTVRTASLMSTRWRRGPRRRGHMVIDCHGASGYGQQRGTRQRQPGYLTQRSWAEQAVQRRNRNPQHRMAGVARGVFSRDPQHRDVVQWSRWPRSRQWSSSGRRDGCIERSRLLQAHGRARLRRRRHADVPATPAAASPVVEGPMSTPTASTKIATVMLPVSRTRIRTEARRVRSSLLMMCRTRST